MDELGFENGCSSKMPKNMGFYEIKVSTGHENDDYYGQK
jgi:hypothetical protein